MTNEYLEELRRAVYNDIDDVPARLIAMFYGDVDTGKTIFALKLAHAITPPDKTIYHVDSSQGFMSIRNHPDLLQAVRGGRLKIMPYQGQTHLDVLAAAIAAKHEEFGNIGCVVLDEATAMYQKMLRLVAVGRATSGKPNKNPDQFDTELQEYGNAGNRWIDIWQKFTALEGVHFISTGHVRDDKLPKGMQSSPAFIPYVNGVIRRDMHLLGFFENKEYEGTGLVRTVQVHGTDKAQAKSRIGGFGIYTTPGDLAQGIIEWLKGDRDGSSQDTVTYEQITGQEQTQEIGNEVL